MTEQKKRSLTAWLATFGVLFVCGLAVAAIDPIREHFLLWELESKNAERRQSAMEALAKRGSLKALPIFLEEAKGDRGLLFPASPFG